MNYATFSRGNDLIQPQHLHAEKDDGVQNCDGDEENELVQGQGSAFPLEKGEEQKDDKGECEEVCQNTQRP